LEATEFYDSFGKREREVERKVAGRGFYGFEKVTRGGQEEEFGFLGSERLLVRRGGCGLL